MFISNFEIDTSNEEKRAVITMDFKDGTFEFLNCGLSLGKNMKHTKSISPISGKEIDAEIIEENGKIYLAKEGKKYLLENDVNFYKLMVREYPEKQSLCTHIGMYVSGKCNMNCPFCYEIKSEEPTFEEIEVIVNKYNKKPIVLGGLEPTLREDLFEIIKMIRKKNYPFLATNGLTLVDFNYVLGLKKSGLWCVIFALNGNETKPILDQKLKALKNLKKIGLRTMMSVMLTKGSNEDKIKEIYDYCMKNRSFITELRFRTQIPIKKFLKVEPFCMSELVEAVANNLKVDKKDIMKEHFFKEEILKRLKYIKGRYSATLQNYFKTRLCSMYFTISKGKSVGHKINLEKAKRSELWLMYYLFRTYGLRFILEKFMFPFIELPNFLKNKNMIQILLRRWQDIYTIDLERNKECCFRSYRGDDFKTQRGIPFCQSLCVK
jgi:organic radical activating enzyme